jgi:hypothetical protein
MIIISLYLMILKPYFPYSQAIFGDDDVMYVAFDKMLLGMLSCFMQIFFLSMLTYDSLIFFT